MTIDKQKVIQGLSHSVVEDTLSVNSLEPRYNVKVFLSPVILVTLLPCFTKYSHDVAPANRGAE